MAFQYCDHDEHDNPTESAVVGALLYAEQQDIIRAFSKAYLKTR